MFRGKKYQQSAKLIEMSLTFGAEIINGAGCVFCNSVTDGALAVKDSHGILLESFKTGSAEIFFL